MDNSIVIHWLLTSQSSDNQIKLVTSRSLIIADHAENFSDRQSIRASLTCICSLKQCSSTTFSNPYLSLLLLLSFPLDDGSEQSSGRDTPASSSSRQGVGDQVEEKGKKDKKKKAKTKKKEKNKGKGKEKEKKKAEEPEETEKKSKKLGFGLLRWVTVWDRERKGSGDF